MPRSPQSAEDNHSQFNQSPVPLNQPLRPLNQPFVLRTKRSRAENSRFCLAYAGEILAAKAVDCQRQIMKSIKKTYLRLFFAAGLLIDARLQPCAPTERRPLALNGRPA